MPYTPPSVSDLKARFPEFTAVSDALVNLILNGEAIPRVGEDWYERDRKTATLYLAAHLLAAEGEPDRSTGGASSSTGPIKRERAGDTEIEYAVTTSSADVTAGDYASSTYGRRFLELLRLNFPAVVAV